VVWSAGISLRPPPTGCKSTAAEPAPDRRPSGCWRGLYAGFAGLTLMVLRCCYGLVSGFRVASCSRLSVFSLCRAEFVVLLPLVGIERRFSEKLGDSGYWVGLELGSGGLVPRNSVAQAGMWVLGSRFLGLVVGLGDRTTQAETCSLRPRPRGARGFLNSTRSRPTK
jgi:hypothetical protein